MYSLSCKEIFLCFSKRSDELLLLMRTREREKGSGRADICGSCIWIGFHYLFYIARKSSFEKGEMERAVENGRIMISFQGKWRGKNKVLPTEKQYSLSSVTSTAIPPTMVESLRETEVTRRYRSIFICFQSMFSAKAIYILSLSFQL